MQHPFLLSLLKSIRNVCVYVRFGNYILIYEKCFQPYPYSCATAPSKVYVRANFSSTPHLLAEGKFLQFRRMCVAKSSALHHHCRMLLVLEKHRAKCVCKEKLMRVVDAAAAVRNAQENQTKTHINKINVHEQHLFSTFNVFRILSIKLNA